MCHPYTICSKVIGASLVIYVTLSKDQVTIYFYVLDGADYKYRRKKTENHRMIFRFNVLQFTLCQWDTGPRHATMGVYNVLLIHH